MASFANRLLDFCYPERIQLDSFNHFVSKSIENILVDDEPLPGRVRIGAVRVAPPTLENIEGNVIGVTPEYCISSHATYGSQIYATLEITEDATNRVSVEACIGRLPLMVGCRLDETVHEDDMRCYFIIKGQRKVVNMEERIAFNHPFLLTKKKEFKFEKYVEMKSMNKLLKSSLLDIGVKSLKYKTLLVYCPELTQRELIPAHIFLNLFITVDELTVALQAIIASAPDADRWKVQELIADNFWNKDYSTSVDVIRVLSKNADVEGIIRDRVLLHMNGASKARKGYFILYLLKILAFGHADIIPPDDRDHYGNKRIYTINHFFTIELDHVYKKKYKKRVADRLQRLIDDGTFSAEYVKHVFEKNQEITNCLKNCLTTNAWHGKPLTIKQYVSQLFDPFNYLHYHDLIRKIVTPVKSDSNKIIGPRDLHLTQTDILCPFSTPDGKKVGLVKQPSAHAHVSVDRGDLRAPIFRALNRLPAACTAADDPLRGDCSIVMLNGLWICCVRREDAQVAMRSIRLEIKYDRRTFDVSVFFNESLNGIFVVGDAGRLMYPVVEREIDGIDLSSLEEYIEAGYVCFVDKNELENYEIVRERGAPPRDAEPSFSLGYSGALIPYANHNQSPRNIYQTSMCKQAIGFVGSLDGVHNTLNYCQQPIVATLLQCRSAFYEHPTGVNVVVAIMPFMGENQEDSIVVNKAALDRGLFGVCRTIIHSKILDNNNILFTPTRTRDGVFNYANLDAAGVVRVGARVEKNDVLVCIKKISGSTQPALDEPEVYLSHAHDFPMRVESAEQSITEKGDVIVKISLVEMIRVEIGDKFSSRHGQKGTVGMIVGQEDLPFDSDGVCPDLIINPLCIPSRMTGGHPLEMAAGMRRPEKRYCSQCVDYVRNCGGSRCKEDCILSQTIKLYTYDTSFYSTLIPDKIKEFRSRTYTCGATGERMKCPIFVGMIYYQRLKHISRDKIYVRTYGPIQPITRQPKEGRSVEGGHRFGVQERDACLSHGCAYALRERLFLASDYFQTLVCGGCGVLHHNVSEKCRVCGAPAVPIELPFATKVLIQFLAGFNINLRLITSRPAIESL